MIFASCLKTFGELHLAYSALHTVTQTKRV